MMLDILHQLLKGVVMRLIEWIQLLVQSLIKSNDTDPRTHRVKKMKSKDKRKPANFDATFQLDLRFRQVPSFVGLKRFRKFSAVSQWIGSEQKQIVRQLIPVVTPLLDKACPAALHCARAILNFVVIAQYNFHVEDTLSYMGNALYRIDKLKMVFKNYRPQDKKTREGHFNILK